jgi:hypothetical protein
VTMWGHGGVVAVIFRMLPMGLDEFDVMNCPLQCLELICLKFWYWDQAFAASNYVFAEDKQ